MVELINFINISKKFFNHTALENINFSIPANSIFGLLGPNGAGKTSLLRILTQIIPPDSGQVLFRQNPLLEKDIFHIGYLPEERGLYKKMKVQEQLVYFGQLKNLSKNEAQTNSNYWLEKLDLYAWRNNYLYELSKGMQQKVQFIATLIHDPELLILDEPFSGFDPVNAELLTAIILELKQKKKTILFSTHRMETVESLCDNIVLIDKGKNILNGDITGIKIKYKENKLMVEGKGESMPESLMYSIIELIKKENGILVAILLPEKNVSINEILVFLMTHLEIKKFQEILPGINEIFLKEVKRKS